MANLAADGNAAEIPFYQQIFAIYNGAPGAGSATSVAGGGCKDFTGLAAGVPCALQFRSTPPDINKEYLWSARVDHDFNDNDRGYIRVLRDNGFQPTFASPFGPTFNEQSNQPQMQGQVSETHVFGPNSVNQFNGSVLFYGAVFVPSDASGALAALPTYVSFCGQRLLAGWRLGRAALSSRLLLSAGKARVPISSLGRLFQDRRQTHFPRGLLPGCTIS